MPYGPEESDEEVEQKILGSPQSKVQSDAPVAKNRKEKKKRR